MEGCPLGAPTGAAHRPLVLRLPADPAGRRALAGVLAGAPAAGMPGAASWPAAGSAPCRALVLSAGADDAGALLLALPAELAEQLYGEAGLVCALAGALTQLHASGAPSCTAAAGVRGGAPALTTSAPASSSVPTPVEQPRPPPPLLLPGLATLALVHPALGDPQASEGAVGRIP
jgi:hypothetical protein